MMLDRCIQSQYLIDPLIIQARSDPKTDPKESQMLSSLPQEIFKFDSILQKYGFNLSAEKFSRRRPAFEYFSNFLQTSKASFFCDSICQKSMPEGLFLLRSLREIFFCRWNKVETLYTPDVVKKSADVTIKRKASSDFRKKAERI